MTRTIVMGAKSVIMHPDLQAIIRRSEHFKRVLLERGLPERIAALRAVQYQDHMWRVSNGYGP